MSARAAANLPDQQLKSVLIATDFSAVSDRAVSKAISVARYYDAKLYIIHIVSASGLVVAGPRALASATESAWRDMAQLEQNLSHRGMLQGLVSSFFVCSGNIYEELEKVVQREHIDLVVVGTSGRKGLGKLFIGSTAEQVFRNSSCPVLTVGPRSATDHDQESNQSDHVLLFPTDFGDASVKTLPHAILLANRLGKRLTLLHVLSSAREPGDRWFATFDATKAHDSARAEAIHKLTDLISQKVTMNNQPTFMVEFDEPSDGILKAASVLHAEVIIMGLNHRSHVETISRLPWSTAYEVVCSAECPVLTLRY